MFHYGPPSSARPSLASIEFAHANFDHRIQPAFDIPAQAFTRLPLVKVTDPLDLWDDANHWYTVPNDGTYQVVARWRPVDNTNIGASAGIGVDVAEQDSPTFEWYVITAGALGSHTTRTTLTSVQIEQFSAGDRIRLFAYVDVAAAVTGLDGADFQIYQLAQPAA